MCLHVGVVQEQFHVGREVGLVLLEPDLCHRPPSPAAVEPRARAAPRAAVRRRPGRRLPPGAGPGPDPAARGAAGAHRDQVLRGIVPDPAVAHSLPPAPAGAGRDLLPAPQNSTSSTPSDSPRNTRTCPSDWCGPESAPAPAHRKPRSSCRGTPRGHCSRLPPSPSRGARARTPP